MKMKLAIFAIVAASTSEWSHQPGKKCLFDNSYIKAGAVAATAVSFVVSPVIAADVAGGKEIFKAQCSVCHFGGRNLLSPQKTLQKDALDKYLEGGRKESSVINRITLGKGHPSFSGKLSEDDIANVASYVISTSETGWE